MGAPPAPPWATIFFGIHKEAVLAQFGDMLQFYRLFINDVLGIWLFDTDPSKDNRKWTAFTLLMQDCNGLEYIFEEYPKTVNFMDMRISICKDRIVTSLYEKPMRLYLDILPHSAHLPGVLTGIVSGNIIRIHSIFSNEDEINYLIKEFYARLLIHGYQRDFFIPVFTKGNTGARAFTKRGSVRQYVSDQEKHTNGRVFFHLTYHSRDKTSKYL